MKAKIGRGTGFRGVLDYAFGDGKSPEIVGGNVVGENPRTLATEFGLSREARSNVAKPVLHVSLSCPPNERLSTDIWRGVTDRFMQLMELDGHQFVAVRHNDTGNDHVHLVSSRIRLDGALWHGKWEAMRAIRATQQIEREFGLTLTPGFEPLEDAAPEQAPTNTGRKNMTQAEYDQADRTGNASVRSRLQAILDDALDGPQSAMALMDRLDAAGVTARPNIASTGRMNGFSFELDGVAFKASQLGKAYAWKKLQERGVEYVQNRDAEALRERADRAATPDSAEPRREPDGAGGGTGAAGDGRQPDRDAVRRIEGGNGVPIPSDVIGREIEDRQRIGEGGKQAQSGAGGTGPENQPDTGDREGRGADRGRGAGNTTGASVVADAIDRDGLGDGWRGNADVIADLASTEPAMGGGPVPQDPRPVTKAQAAKVQAWRQQHEALGSDLYRVTMMWSEGGKKSAMNLGKGRAGDGAEKFYSATEIENLIPYLSRENLMGRNIYITPIDPEHHYLVVDDMTTDTLAEFDQVGYRPALVQESSPGSIQAILKAPRAGDGDQQAANLVVVGVNRRYGDQAFSGAIHPFRLAGFANKKPGKGNPFTRVLRAVGGLCERTGQLLDQARQKLAAAVSETRVEAHRAPRRRIAAEAHDPFAPATDAASQRHDALRRSEVLLAHTKGWEIDQSRLDYRVAKRMLAEGFDRDDIEAALVARSPDITTRHPDVHGYVRRTTTKAAGGEIEGPELG